jgi:hypothetical protein
MHDVRDGSRERRRMLGWGICHDLLPSKIRSHYQVFDHTAGPRQRAPGRIRTGTYGQPSIGARVYISDMSEIPLDETSGEIADARLDSEAEAEARLDAEAEAEAELEPEAEGEL